jgi:hypothetical protein
MCKNILETEIFQKYDNNLLHNIIIQNSNEYMYCPYESCSKILYIKGIDTNKIRCNYCHHKISTCCKSKDWHKGFCMNSEENKAFLKSINSKKIKPCPKCNIYIEKESGCDHIYCPNCKTHINWKRNIIYKNQKQYYPDERNVPQEGNQFIEYMNHIQEIANALDN